MGVYRGGRQIVGSYIPAATLKLYGTGLFERRAGVVDLEAWVPDPLRGEV